MTETNQAPNQPRAGFSLAFGPEDTGLQLTERPDRSASARRRRRQRGFTLIEILVVVTILGIIASIAGVAVMNALDQSKIDTTKIQLSEIAKALDIYKVKYNRYPTTQEGLQALKNPPKDGKPVMEVIKKDEWDADFIYVCPGQHNPSKFDLQSKGPDGTADSEDDITNW